MIYQYACNISHIAVFDEISDLTGLISEERRDRIKRFRFDADKVRSLLAELILRQALWECYDISAIQLEKNAYGKPFLADHRTIHFSLSHSGEWVVCVVGDQNLGVDVERIEAIEPSLADEYFTDEEAAYLSAFSEEERRERFYTLWTLKESYTKTVGQGLSIPLDSFGFCLEGDRIECYLEGKMDDRYQFWSRELDEQHKMALCVQAQRECVRVQDIRYLTLQEIRKWTCEIGK